MAFLLFLSGLAAIATGVGHSWLGERYVLGPLLASTPEPQSLRQPVQRRLLRAVWHLPSLIWAIMGIATFVLAWTNQFDWRFLIVFGAIYVASAAGNLFAVRGPHVGQALLLTAAGLMALSFV